MNTKVNVFVGVLPPNLSQGIHRVSRALTQHAPPWVNIVAYPEASDIEVIHVIGHGSMIGKGLGGPRDYAMVQYCLRTSEDPTPAAWVPSWAGARLVWSYYNLPEYVADSGWMATSGFNFYLAPLGVDTSIFRRVEGVQKQYIAGTSGYVAPTESVGEVVDAARAVGGRVFHLGPNLGFGDIVSAAENVDDWQLSLHWNACWYVSGLRRIEGFELPALEGLVCGARPLLYDLPDYRRWMGEHAVLVPEGTVDEVREFLREVFSNRTRAVVEETERVHVAQRFDWGPIVRGFWDRLEATL